MKKGLFGILVLILIASIVTVWDRETGRLELRLDFQEGKTYSQRMLTEQEIHQTIAGQQYDVTQTIGMGYSYTISEVDADGNAWIKATYDSTILKQESPMGGIEYDSSNPPEVVDPAAMGFAALVGQGFRMKLSPQGYIQDIQGVDEMITRMLEQFGLLQDPALDALEQSLRDQFGEKAIKESMGNTMAIYPETPVKVGDAWNKTVVVSLGFPMILENTWTLVERQSGVAMIEVHSTIEPNLEEGPVEIGLTKLSYNISGEQWGTVEIDESTGWTLYSGITQQVSGTITLEGGDLGDETITWPISLESTLTLETVEE